MVALSWTDWSFCFLAQWKSFIEVKATALQAYNYVFGVILQWILWGAGILQDPDTLENDRGMLWDEHIRISALKTLKQTLYYYVVKFYNPNKGPALQFYCFTLL